MEVQTPKVGVGVMIFKDHKILLGKRLGSHGAGEYSVPGGHLEYMESIENCARRETKEECGLEIKEVRFQFISNVIKYAPKHYLHVGMLADWKSGEPAVLEADKTESWGWYDLANLPSPLFEMCQQAISLLNSGQTYLDSEPHS